jgi:hypothetical protein
MDVAEQARWLKEHIPHRIRAAAARLPMQNSLLQVTAAIDPHPLTAQGRIFWRFATDSIWEGRLVAMRWLIEFVGVKENSQGPAECQHNSKFPHDVFIDDIDGGVFLSLKRPEAQLLARVWGGCSQASSHATKDTHTHHPIDEKTLAEALTVILNYLQDGIYARAGLKLQDYVLESVQKVETEKQAD